MAVRYLRMFDMTNDSHLFWTRARLEAHGAYPVERGRWRKGEEEWVPLYEGKMVQAFDHRAASITVNPENVHHPAQSEAVSELDHADPNFIAEPQFWLSVQDIVKVGEQDSWCFGFKNVTAPTNMTTMIGGLIPNRAAGDSLPLLISEQKEFSILVTLGSALNSIVCDFVIRSKVQGQNLNWLIVEQIPVPDASAYVRAVGSTTAAAIVADHVLRLTYTAWEMEPFARDMGYDGPPFRWDDDERRHLRARLDALYFHLYGVTDEEDVRYVLSTFPILERKDREAHDGVYLTGELVVWYMRALAAGDPDADAPVATIIRDARRRAA